MKFNEIMDGLFSGKSVYCGSNRYHVEGHMLHRNGSPTFTIDFFELASDNWYFDDESSTLPLSVVKNKIKELAKQNFSSILDYKAEVDKIVFKCDECHYAHYMELTSAENVDDVIPLLEDCLSWNVNNKDTLVGYQVVTLDFAKHAVIVYLFYKEG